MMMKLFLASSFATALLLPNIVCANDVWEDATGGGRRGQDMWEQVGGNGGDGVGDYDYGGGGGPDDVLLGILMEQGMAMAMQCDIDILGLAGAAGSLSDANADNSLATPGTVDANGNSFFDMETFKFIATLFAAPTCSASEADQFRSAFQKFESCSTFDLEKILESMEDALVGAFLECVVAVAPLVDGWTNSNNNPIDDEFVIPDLCVESFFGKNPLGDMLRTMHLKPDQVLPCFSTLSTSIPSCTLQRWPIPLIGPILKKATCLFGATMPLLEAIAKVDLMTLNTCLPQGDSSPSSCQTTIAQCVQAGSSSMGMPEPLLGAPLSDTSKRVAAKENGLENVPARYQSFVDSCVTNLWAGWTYENHDYEDGTSISASAPKPAPPPATTPTSSNSGDSSSEKAPPPCESSSTTPLLGAQQAQQKAAYAANESTGGSSSGTPPSAGGHFGGGLLTGVILTGAMWAFMTYREKKAGRKAYETVEMVGAGGYSVA